MQEIDTIQNKGRPCFTKFRYSTNIHKRSFDSDQHAAVCKLMQTCIFAGIHACTRVSFMYVSVRGSESARVWTNLFIVVIRELYKKFTFEQCQVFKRSIPKLERQSHHNNARIVVMNIFLLLSYFCFFSFLC